MPHFEINNLIPVVKDVGNGKQPLGTLFETVNLVPNKKRESLVSRNGYTTGLAVPSGVSTLDKYLTFPVTYPTSIDYHGYFFRDSGSTKHICWKPYYHNSASVATINNGWVDISEKVTFTVNAQFLTDTTITGTPTNTYVLANATTTYGLSATTDYYKNYVLCLTSFYTSASITTSLLIKSYSVTGGTATFTLDHMMDTAGTFVKTYITGASIQRYFHQDKSVAADQSGYFTPSYTSPAGYFTETGIFFSGGAGSTVGYKNMHGAYYDKTFFSSVGGSSHRFQGTYFEQAEIFKPSSSILKSIAQANSFSSELLTPEANRGMSPGNNWTQNGNHKLQQSTINGDNAIFITNEGEGDDSANNISLANTYTGALTNAVIYKINLVYTSQTETTLYIKINGQTLSVQLAKTGAIVERSGFKVIIKAETATAEIQFTASGTTAPTIQMWFKSNSAANILEMNVFLYSDDTITLRKGKTVKYYGIFI